MNIFFIADFLLAIFALVCNSKNKKLILIISGGLLLTLTCLNNGQGDPNDYGYDFPEYINFFVGRNSMYGSVSGEYELEWPYYVFCKLLGFWGAFDFVYILGIGLTIGVPFLIVTKKYSNNPALTVFLLLTILNTQTYLFFLSVHRQMLANSLIFISLIILTSNYHNKRIISALLLLLALFAHSTSFFVIPFLLLLYFINYTLSKKTAYIILFVTFVAGIFISKLLESYYSGLILLLGNIEEIERSTHYIVDDVYDGGNTSFNVLFPLTFITGFVVAFAQKEEISSFSMKCMLFATSVYNLLAVIPLMDRSLTTFILLGIAGSIPKKINTDIPCKIVMMSLLTMQLYLANKAYHNPSFRLLPFHFIWE